MYKISNTTAGPAHTFEISMALIMLCVVLTYAVLALAVPGFLELSLLCSLFVCVALFVFRKRTPS